jgi:glycosyltransferase involved in cell wall biosynthesis
MDIAIVHPALDVKGGAENVVVSLASGLVDRGHRVRVITSRADRRLFTSNAWNFETVELGGHGYRLSWRGMRRTARRLRPLLQGADLVNPHNFPANFWTYWALREESIPAAWFCQEPLRVLYRPPLDPHVRQLMRERRLAVAHRVPISRLADAAHNAYVLHRVKAMDRQVARWFPVVLTNSSFVAQQVQTLFERPASVCRLGIPLGLAPATIPGDPRPGLELLTVARLTVEKNVGTIFRALAHLTEPIRSQVRLTVVGTGPEQAYLLRLRDELGLRNAVTFGGFVSDDEVDRLYRACDALVYLSLDETFGLAFAEAAARSKPSIGPDHGGPIEFIENGRTGLLVDPLNPEAVAAAIARLAGDPQLRQTMGRAARQKVAADYTIDAMVSRYLALVQIAPESPALDREAS